MKINIKGLIDEDFVNYKKPSMFIAFPNCTFKCEKECEVRCCQNSALAQQENIEVETEDIAVRYVNNSITSAIVIGGLEPFDDTDSLISLLSELRNKTDDDIVIYTGYTESEICQTAKVVGLFKNIIIKFGRFIPNQEKRFDEVLGVYLASDNQYAKRIS